MQLWEDGRTYPVWLRRPKREEYFQLSDLCGWSCSREGISRPPGSAGTPLGSEAPSGASPVLRVNADNSLKNNKIKNPMLFLWWYCQTNKRQVGCVYVKYNGQTVFPSSLLQKNSTLTTVSMRDRTLNHEHSGIDSSHVDYCQFHGIALTKRFWSWRGNMTALTDRSSRQYVF